MVKISVVVPVYNAEPFLEDAINSVLNQTFKDFEVVCVNDGSKDNSLEMLNDFAKKDNRIKVINKENGGCGSARNRALDESCGDYIYFFDPDDYILPNTFEELYNNAINNDSDLVIFKIARFYEGDEIDYSVPGFEFEKVFKKKDFNNFTFNYKKIKKYVLNSSFAPWSKLYKHEFLNKYEDFRFDLGVAFDDTPFHVKSLLRAEKISYVPDFFYHYRFNPNSVNNTSSNGVDIFKICDLIEMFLKDEKYYCDFIEEFKLFKVTQILNYMLSTDSEEYFKLAKNEFYKLNIGKINKLGKYNLKRYKLVLKSKNYEEFKKKDYELYIKQLKISNKHLRNQNKQLRKKNKKLKKQFNKVKKFNKELTSSKSWRITKYLRK